MVSNINLIIWRKRVEAALKRWDADPLARYRGDLLFDEFVFVSQARNWADFLEWHESLKGTWGFRGHRKADWFLDSSLDRAVRIQGSTEHSSFFQHLDRQMTEERLLFKFKQQAHRFLKHLPAEPDLVSWLALMQHHGAPTRLLDWTKSPYVAAYFAFESEPERREDQCAIWAVDLDWLKQRGSQLLQAGQRPMIPNTFAERSAYLNALLKEREVDGQPPQEKAIVVEVEPARTDAWMTSQLGFFLSKVYFKASFSDLLMTMMLHPQLIDQPKIWKLQLSSALRFEVLQRLRTMNIHRGSLFPDMDGFARSLDMEWQIGRESIRREMENAGEPPGDELDDGQSVE